MSNLATVKVFLGPVIPSMICKDQPIVFGVVLQIFDELALDLLPVFDGKRV